MLASTSLCFETIQILKGRILPLLAQSMYLVAPGQWRRVVGGGSALKNIVETSENWFWRGDILWS